MKHLLLLLCLTILLGSCATVKSPANCSTRNNTNAKVKYKKADKYNAANRTTRSLYVRK